MIRTWNGPAILLLASVIAAVGSSLGTSTEIAVAADAVWSVKHRLLGQHGAKSADISGIACSVTEGFPRSCLVIDDNLQEAQFVKLKDGELAAGPSVKLIDNTFHGKAIELDGEGVAFASGYYYVMGSHGHPRDKKGKLDPGKDADEITSRILASSQIVRFRSVDDERVQDLERTSRLREILASDPVLRPFLDARLEKNGLTIEGIAIKHDELFAGLRGPVLDNNRAVVVSVSVDSLFGGTGTMHHLYRLPLGEGLGIRDLAVFDGRVLILAGPVASGSGKYGIFSWSGESETVSALAELAFDAKRKPEGLLPLEKNGTGLRVLILFDGDKEGSPTPVVIPSP